MLDSFYNCLEFHFGSNMSVNSFDPGAASAALNREEVDALLQSVDEEANDLGLASADLPRYAPMVVHSGWPDIAKALPDDALVTLVRFFTLAEMRFAGWQAGDKSAVIPLVRELKSRQAFDKTLRKWVKANTDNRFLPHGSLMDRL